MIKIADRKQLERLYKDALRSSKLSSNNPSYNGQYNTTHYFNLGYENGIKDALSLLGYTFNELESMFQQVLVE